MAKTIQVHKKKEFKVKIKRKGVHAKTKQSFSKTSKLYVKPNKGQGK